MKNTFLIDLDGTLYSGSAPMPFAAEFAAFLNARHFTWSALTNCPSKTREQVAEKLGNMGIAIPAQNVLTSGMAAASILKNKHKFHSVFTLGTPALAAECERVGLRCDDTAPDAVLVGFDPALTYERLRRACTLVNNGARLFCTNPDNVIPFNGEHIPHSGALAKAVECATGQAAIYIGKPFPGMFDIAREMWGYEKDNCVMIGDRLDTDGLFARNCGMEFWWVAPEKPDGVCAPGHAFNNLSEIIAFIKEKHPVREPLSTPPRRLISPRF